MFCRKPGKKNQIINIQNNDRVRLILMGIFHNIGIQYSLGDLQITVWGFVEFLQLQAEINFFFITRQHTLQAVIVINCYKKFHKDI